MDLSTVTAGLKFCVHEYFCFLSELTPTGRIRDLKRLDSISPDEEEALSNILDSFIFPGSIKVYRVPPTLSQLDLLYQMAGISDRKSTNLIKGLSDLRIRVKPSAEAGSTFVFFNAENLDATNISELRYLSEIHNIAVVLISIRALPKLKAVDMDLFYPIEEHLDSVFKGYIEVGSIFKTLPASRINNLIESAHLTEDADKFWIEVEKACAAPTKTEQPKEDEDQEYGEY